MPSSIELIVGRLTNKIPDAIEFHWVTRKQYFNSPFLWFHGYHSKMFYEYRSHISRDYQQLGKQLSSMEPRWTWIWKRSVDAISVIGGSRSWTSAPVLVGIKVPGHRHRKSIESRLTAVFTGIKRRVHFVTKGSYGVAWLDLKMSFICVAGHSQRVIDIHVE